LKRFRSTAVVGAGALNRDLTMIFARAVQGQVLEKDKAYQATPPGTKKEPAAGGKGEGKGSRRTQRRILEGSGVYDTIYTFNGEEKQGDETLAQFTLSDPPPAEESNEDKSKALLDSIQIKPEYKTEGNVSVSLDDGLVTKMNVAYETKAERKGLTTPSFSSTRKMTTSVSRISPPPEK
jgi:hypothetical protein